MVRHGTTDWNREKRLQGQLDLPINSQGRREAMTVSNRLKSEPISDIFSSDLLRCRQTASFIRNRHPQSIYHETNFLREANSGIMGGKNIRRLMGSELSSLNALKEFFKHYGESMEDVFNRIWKFLNYLLSRKEEFEGKTIVFVTHGGPIRMILGKLLGYKQSELRLATNEIKISNCSITEIVYENAKWEIKSINDTEHLNQLKKVQPIL